MLNEREIIADLSDSALTARLYEIRRLERGLLVEFLEHLAEVDRRRVHLELGFPSLFAFLTDHLGCTKAAAFRRATAARLLARYPEARPYLEDGRLGLTTFVELRDVLEKHPARELLDRAAGRTEEGVKELVATLQPREPPRDLLQRLPAPSLAGSSGLEPGLAPAAPSAPSAPSRPRLEPISAELRVLRMTVGRDFVADLERCAPR